jgi:DNA invertase Pin-like site-specific DNA recombinase
MGTDELAALAAATADPDPLEGLRALAGVRTEVERREAALVRRARNEGASWASIAAALGVSKQAVHKKHGGKGLLGGRS